MSDILMIDCETTAGGDGPEVELIQFSCGKTGIESDPITINMQPKKPVLPSATVIHGMTQEDVEKFPLITNVISKVYEALQARITPDTYVAAYNSAFDVEVIHRAFQRYLNKTFAPKKQFDILRLAQKLIPKEESGNHRLDTVYYYVTGKLDHLMEMRQTHDAASDVLLTQEVLEGLWDLAENKKEKDLSLEELVKFAYEPNLLEKWPWGKHAGDQIGDVIQHDSGYINWFLSKSWSSDSQHMDLLYTIKALGGMK